MNKKTYIIPAIEVVTLESQSMMLTASNQFGVTDETTGENADLSNRHRGEWGNLWAKDENNRKGL